MSSSNNYNHINDYLDGVISKFKLGITSEHTFRKDLEVLINNLSPTVNVTNEPSNVTDCGNPDFLISKKHIPIGFIEAKDIGKNLNSKQYDEQFNRYKDALDNLIVTDYLHFQFFISGELVNEIKIGESNSKNCSIEKIEGNFEHFAELLKDFCLFVGQTIKSAQKLATLMAGKARLLENTLYNAVISDEDKNLNTDLREQYQTFKSVLIHDLTPKDFADIYAQTLAYGMFAARLHDDTLDTFSRQEAAELIPRTNPFLRRLFDYVAGANIDERIKPTVDNLAEVFRATDVAEMLKNFGKTTQTQDPIIHFYETFLAEYNPKLRKQRGVWYTPEPVVQFIVRAVDDVLKSEFSLVDGIADISKVEVEKQTQTRDSRTKSGFKTIKELVHKVQILDPATGTGTFLAAIIQHIFHSQFENMGGVWSSYVEQELLPRLHGFELLMASYAMAHLKLDMLLADTGYEPIEPKRLQVYLTNSLEKHHPDTGTLFAGWLSAEANEANAIKRDAPVMVVLGNPPYSGVSSNNNDWINGLIEDYKYVDGEHFNERKHWLNDDYVKFIRYGQHFIEKNGEGVLAFINPHGFLDNPTFRGMRWNLLTTFDEIYTINLHGNSNTQVRAPDGSKDENVFDIMQGVSINIFIKKKNPNSRSLANVYRTDLYGTRNFKYDYLRKKNLNNIDFELINPTHPNYYFNSKFSEEKTSLYNNGFQINELFKIYSTGVQTSRDDLAVSFDINEAKDKIDFFTDTENTDEQVRGRFFKQTSTKYPAGDARDWKLSDNRVLARSKNLNEHIQNYAFRPFDNRKIVFDDSILSWSRYEVSKHLLHDNIALITARSSKNKCDHFYVSKFISDVKCGERTTGSIFCPLYTYEEDQSKIEYEELGSESCFRTPNLNKDIIKTLSEKISSYFTNEKTDKSKTFAPIDTFDYIYAVLHSPTYRDTYKDFLKIDFPRVPYPKGSEQFWQLVELGSQLRQIHLLESPMLAEKSKALGINYPKGGNNEVTRKMTNSSLGFESSEDDASIGRVWVNDEQYFDNIPLIVWNFYIGGYQPAQKWLKDRKDRILNISDVKHYINIIAALSLTYDLMQKIDAIDIVG